MSPTDGGGTTPRPRHNNYGPGVPANSAPPDSEAAARDLLDQRMTAVRALVHARQQVTDARAALDAAERGDAAAYAAATRAGWTDGDLQRVGLPAPSRRPPGRPRQTQTRPSAASAGGAAGPQPPLPAKVAQVGADAA